jgi:thymidylate synthase
MQREIGPSLGHPQRNVSFATISALQALTQDGLIVDVRGQRTKEILSCTIAIERPLERYLFVPGRNHDVFAQIAESLWVIAGRSDVAWLTPYLPRAPQFSDDGKVWRAGYGPRLRRWNTAIDQLDEVRKLLVADPLTRRAAISLFDPASDFGDSKDIPCNNWLSFIARDGRLHLNVALRSNDVVWGFSGANVFEWSVLHELMARWIQCDVGSLTFFVTSLHLYESHFDRALDMLRRFRSITPYDFAIGNSRMQAEWPRFAALLNDWFALEEISRKDLSRRWSRSDLDDPFLLGCLQIVRLKWGARSWSDGVLSKEMAALEETDWLAAAYEYFGRGRPAILDNIPHQKIRAFFAEYRKF